MKSMKEGDKEGGREVKSQCFSVLPENPINGKLCIRGRIIFFHDRFFIIFYFYYLAKKRKYIICGEITL